MNIYKLMYVIAFAIILLTSTLCYAGDDDTKDISQWQDLGDGQYMTEDGEIVQTEDMQMFVEEVLAWELYYSSIISLHNKWVLSM